MPCADGTIYVLTGKKDTLYWLAGEKAVPVPIADILRRRESEWEAAEQFTPFSYTADPHGGLYLMGGEHLWYVKSGTAKQVTTRPASAIQPSEHVVTKKTLRWLYLGAATTQIREFGYDEGHWKGREEGYDEGWESGREEGYDEGWKSGSKEY